MFALPEVGVKDDGVEEDGEKREGVEEERGACADTIGQVHLQQTDCEHDLEHQEQLSPRADKSQFPEVARGAELSEIVERGEQVAYIDKEDDIGETERAKLAGGGFV